MAIAVYFCDMRAKPSTFRKCILPWRDELAAYDAVSVTVGDEIASTIEADLQANNTTLTVSWNNRATDERSEVGGVGSLDWYVPDHSEIVVVYEDRASPEQLDEFERWVLENDQIDEL